MAYVDFKQVKGAVTIVQILGRYDLTDSFKKRGDALRGRCPIHHGDNPTEFSVSTAKNCFRCFSCDASGNVLDFVAAMEDVSIREAALQIQDWFGLTTAPRKRAQKKPQEEKVERRKPEQPLVNKPLSFSLTNLDRHHPYLRERGLMAETVATFGLGYCSKGIMADRIAIPIHNAKGELVAYAGRSPGDPPEGEGKYKFPPRFSKSMELFNFHRAREHNGRDLMPFVVVEGFFDAIVNRRQVSRP